jgi:hypothetical protein
MPVTGGISDLCFCDVQPYSSTDGCGAAIGSSSPCHFEITSAYAIATLAAVGFAGVLVFIMRSDEVRGFLLNLIRTALALP